MTQRLVLVTFLVDGLMSPQSHARRFEPYWCLLVNGIAEIRQDRSFYVWIDNFSKSLKRLPKNDRLNSRTSTRSDRSPRRDCLKETDNRRPSFSAQYYRRHTSNANDEKFDISRSKNSTFRKIKTTRRTRESETGRGNQDRRRI